MKNLIIVSAMFMSIGFTSCKKEELINVKATIQPAPDRNVPQKIEKPNF